MELKKDLENTPMELEYSLIRGIAKAKKQSKRTCIWKIPAITLSSLAIAFVLLVNFVPAAASAMNNISFLEPIVEAVSFDTSLKTAVEHNYVQLVEKTQTIDEVTVTIEYIIVDASSISIFYSVTAPYSVGPVTAETIDDNNNFMNKIASVHFKNEGGLRIVRYELKPFYDIPKEFTFHINLKKNNNSQLPEKYFQFKLAVDEKYTQAVDTVKIDRWIEIADQKIYLKQLEIYPTQAKLILDTDVHNDSLIRGIDLYFKDNDGNIYNPKTFGMSNVYDYSTYDLSCIQFESSYFTDASLLNLYINGISIVEKDKKYGVIDYSNRTITNLPEGVSITSMMLNGSDLDIELKAENNSMKVKDAMIDMVYYDQEFNSYHIDQMGMTSYGENATSFHNDFTIKNFVDKKFQIRWLYGPLQRLSKPMKLNFKLK
jgi:hypothetical protein